METVKYMTSLLTFYLKGSISENGNLLTLKKPNTILGLIPLGAKSRSVPVTQILSVESNFRLKFGQFLSGAIITTLGVVLTIFGIPLVIIGANKIITSFKTELFIRTTSGEDKKIQFLVFDKRKVDRAEKMIGRIISQRLDDTNLRIQTERLTDAILQKNIIDSVNQNNIQ